jgi:hypothetical protein
MWTLWTLWTLTLPARAAPGADIAAAIARCGAAAHPLPTLTEPQLAALTGGEVVRIVTHGDPNAPSTAVGMALLRGGRDALWVAAQDPHAVVDPTLSEFVVEWFESDHALWYGHLDLPRPIRDRQWVIDSKNSHGLASATGGACWEHHWTLVSDGLPRARAMVAAGGVPKVTLDAIDTAIFTPVNTGAWLMTPLSDGRTLVAYQATSVVGGAIPDWLVLQLSMSRLESVLRDLEARAGGWAREHYVAGHEAVLGGTGAPISTF